MTRSRLLAALPGLVFVAGALLSQRAARAEGTIYKFKDPTYRHECGSCHVAYPPQLLGADGWHELFKGLDRHFGVDASLDAKTAGRLESYTVGLAGPISTRPEAPPRITQTHWFRSEHNAVGHATWRDRRVMQASNCPACHRGAERGDYTDRTLRVPGETARGRD
jgi:hypothetical protein